MYMVDSNLFDTICILSVTKFVANYCQIIMNKITEFRLIKSTKLKSFTATIK